MVWFWFDIEIDDRFFFEIGLLDLKVLGPGRPLFSEVKLSAAAEFNLQLELEWVLYVTGRVVRDS